MMATRDERAPLPGAPPLPLRLTSFVGRERELADLCGLLTGCRLLTLTGAGGCGKTCLALKVAEGTAGGYPDGVWLVELATVSDAAFVERAVAAALGVAETQGAPLSAILIQHLRPKSALIILDNCEHVVETAAHLAESILRACPAIRILATSREALAVEGEVTWPVPPLALPPWPVPQGTAAAALTAFAAVRLFIDRARAVLPEFVVTDENVPVLAEICVRLDGIPLALELAAARLRVFTLEQILARLDDRFHLLTTGPRTASGRQQTLRALIDWSYALLSEPERVLLARLSVFAAGWEITGAEAVGAGSGIQHHAVLDLLGQLVEKSLVVVERDSGVARYRLLETIRQYAREKLEEAGEARAASRRLFDHILALATRPGTMMQDSDDPAAFDRLERELGNVREALRWSLDAGGGEQALTLCEALTWFWWRRSHFQEGAEWLEQALARAPERTALRMRALAGAGWLTHHLRQLDTARELLTESVSIARERGDRWSEAWALHALGRVAYFEKDAEGARVLGEQSLAVAEEVGDPWLIAWPVHLLGIAAYLNGDYATTRARYEQALAIRRELDHREGVQILLSLLGLVALREGDLARAREVLYEALDIVVIWEKDFPMSMALALFACLAERAGQPERAARLAAASARLGETNRTPLIPLAEELLLERLAAARRALGDTAFDAAWAEGQRAPVERCIAEMRAVAGAPASAPAPPPASLAAGFAGLTPAELRVLRLLAAGRTTREIAAELVVAVSTVDRHLTHIFAKLGVSNRAAATAVAVKHGLG